MERFIEADFDRIRAAAQSSIEKHQIPGISIGVVQGDDLVFCEAFGHADIEAKTPMDPARRQCIASITKTMVGLCTMALVDEGRLRLEDRVVDLLPDLKFEPAFGGSAETMQVWHLLTHTGGIGEAPTGSRDPFALRRAALGVIRLIVENKLRFGLNAAFDTAAKGFGRKIAFQAKWLLDFFADRLKVALREKGIRHDLIDSVFSLGGEDDLVRLLARVEALRSFIESDDGKNLLVAYRRAANIVKIEAKKDKLERYGVVDPARYAQAEEKALAAALDKVAAESGALIGKEDFAGAMRLLAGLRQPVDAFFDKVTVNAPDRNLRLNRLALLQRLAATMDKIADFSRIEG